MTIDGLFTCRGRTGDVPGFLYMGQATGDPQWSLYRRVDDPRIQANQHHSNGYQTTDWQALTDNCERALTPKLRDELAGELGVPPSFVSALRVGWYAKEGCWTFPEYDATATIIGIQRRYRDGKKLAWKGSTRGLYIPLGWTEREGTILLPEGASDTLSLWSMGLVAIGRPSNMGGVDQLAALLRKLPSDREIVVLGEIDPKSDGTWPGRDGAERSASELSRRLGRFVPWAMPPDAAKDARQWFSRQAAVDLTCQDALEEAGERFLGHVNTHKQGRYDPHPDSYSCPTTVAGQEYESTGEAKAA